MRDCFSVRELEQQVRDIAAYVPPASLERLAHLFTGAYVRQRRLAQRAAAIMELAQRYPLASGRAIAKALRADLRHVATRSTRSLAPDHATQLAHVLALSGGRVPSLSTVRSALAGIGQNSGEDLGHTSSDTSSRPDDLPPSGRNLS